MLDKHQRALDKAVWAAEDDTEIIGLLVCGSVARGDALPDSDVDLRVLLDDAATPRPFRAGWQGGVFVEQTYLTASKTRERLGTRPMEVYPYREGRILYDPNHTLRDLCGYANTVYDAYAAPASEKTEMRYWLDSTKRKINAALEAGETERAALVSATSVWPLLTGLFLAANRPLPPSGAVRANLPDACERADNLPIDTVRQLWNAHEPNARTEATLAIILHILPLL